MPRRSRRGNGRRSGRKGRSGRRSGVNADNAGNPLVRQIADCHRFVRRDIRTLDLGSTGAGFGAAYTFSLNSVPNSSDFTNLFDSYAIERVSIALLAGSAVLQVYGAPDYDDSVAPVGIADLIERQNVLVRSLNVAATQQFRATIVPRVQVNAGVSTGTMLAPPSVRLDCADPSTAHFGYKLWIQPSSGTPTLPPTLVFTYHLKFWSAK